MGDRRENLRRAINRLRENVAIDALSSVYDTAPVGLLDQPRFLNLACAGETKLKAHELLIFAKGIERQLGRLPTVPYGPRVIDIDILLYDGVVVHLDDLTIPHPRLRERAFVLAPLAEIAPDAVDPTDGRTIAELWRALPAQDVRPLAEDEGRLADV